MTKHICIIDGHPDPDHQRFIHAICNAYSSGATDSGHPVSRIDIAQLEAEPLRLKDDFTTPPPERYVAARDKIIQADHIALAFPLWLGSMPAATRAFFEQIARDNFFLGPTDNALKWPQRMMKGKSARIIVTMGMPGFVYRSVFSNAAVKALERGMFGISGFKPVKHTVYGSVEGVSIKKRERWLDEVRQLGAAAR